MPGDGPYRAAPRCAHRASGTSGSSTACARGTVGSAASAGAAGALGEDRAGDPEEPLRVYADPAGHPFCVFVG